MSNAATVLNSLKRYGAACTVTWPAIGSGPTKQPALSVSSYVRISQKVVANNAGALTFAATAMLPGFDRSLQGASIHVNSRTYTVASSVEKIADGVTYMNTAILT